LSNNRKAIPDEKPKVPAYIVTFSDMVTLLLTFFVLLLTLAQVQDPELLNKGRDSFIESIRMLGLGMLSGQRQSPYLGKLKTKYFISESDDSLVVRTIDAKEEVLRQLFKKLTQSMTAMPSQIVGETTKFSVTDIRFGPGEAALNESGEKFLTEFCANLQLGSTTKKIKLYVLGLAPEQGSPKEQWLLSARRARAVADVLNDLLPANFRWPVYSWGAGPGGDWVGSDSPISEKLHIMIAVLRTGD